MNFISNIFNKKIDDSIHLQFQKFSRGEFKNRAIIKIRNSGGKYTIFTTYEFANDLVKITAEKLGSDKTKVTGAIISTLDLTGKLDFQGKKQFMGVKQYVIEKEMSGNEIIKICEEFPKTFIALSFKIGDSGLKIKAKAPKSAKPGNKGDKKPVPNFCKLTTRDKQIARDFIFEAEDFKKAEIYHTFIIKEIIMPQGEKDFAKIRELSKRKGTIIREAIIDGKTTKKEVEFLA